MLEATRDNLDARTINIMRQIAMDKEQADANARAKIFLKPEMSPAMPKPMLLPRPEYQDVYKPKQPPRPKKMTAYQQSSGGFGAAMSSLAAATPSIVNAFKGGGYQPRQAIGSVSSLMQSGFGNYQTEINDANSFFGNALNTTNTFGGYNGIGDFGLTGFNSSNIT
jgi:hypothetical protein